MDFKDSIKQISERIEKLKGNLHTEEATKNALIMPMIQSLGYDVFNPLEVMPEYICDIGTKKGEKIDYAIMNNGEPILLIECKHWNQELTLHDNQLLRYFHVSKAKFGLLTNGIIYRFYTDLETPNKMDEKPFLEINLLDTNEGEIEELKKFHKTYFDVENILSSASELKYTNALKAVISKEFSNPSPEMVKFLAKQVYDGMITTKLLDQFTELVKRSISSIISDRISNRLKTALNTESVPVVTDRDGNSSDKESIDIDNDNGIVTTEEEMEGFRIVKALLCGLTDLSRIAHRDALSYFAILFDDNNRKPICRLYFNSSNKYISTFDEDKKETKHPIQSIDDIYNHRDLLRNTIKGYLGKE